MIVGWKADTNMRATLVTDTLEMATWARGRTGVTDLTGLIHHSDAGSQYVSLALTERLAALGIRASIGTIADAYDCQARSARFREDRVVPAMAV